MKRTVNVSAWNDFLLTKLLVPWNDYHVSDNTEWGSLKLTRCSHRKKVHETKNLSAKERWNTNSKTYISAEVFFLTCDQTFFVFFLRGGLDLIAIQSNHLLGNPRYTVVERLLANLTDLRFRKNGFESHRSNSTASPDLSHAKNMVTTKEYYGISQIFFERTMVERQISRK